VAGESLPQIEVADRAAWRGWLSDHHAESGSVWLVVPRKGMPGHLTYDDIVEEALCFGWVDSLVRKRDAVSSMLLISPRKPKSAWSAPNKARVEKLEALGLMTPAGRRLVEEAKASGKWSLLDGVEAGEIPNDLMEALESLPPAREQFEAFPRSIKRGILEWIIQAKKPETRAKRVAETATLAQKGERANQFRR
jgi:uncharacterized protein YdeI (YjbR/CyaY-like superfamily)